MISKLKYTALSLLIIFAYSAAHAVINGVNVTVTASVLCNNGTIEKNFAGGCPGAWNEGALPVVDTSPVLFFSDLDSGPDSGWSAAEPNKGVAVTIWGRNLGATRGSSYVTVNGVNLDSASDYPDTWGEYNDPVPHLQRVTFHLKSTMTDGAGTISVTTSEGTSNTLPFTIRSGRILFVDDDVTQGNGSGTLTDPYSPYDIFANEQAGDTIYWRAGTYNQNYYGNGSGNFYLASGHGVDGTASNPVALVGYPGEVALFDTFSDGNGSSSFRYAFATTQDYWTISRLSFLCWGECIRTDSYNRIIGNDVEGQKVADAGTGHIVNQHNGSLVAVNAIHGATIGATGNDHAYYAQGCADVEGNTVAHNYIYNNDLYNDAHIVVNHQQSRCSNSQQVKSHYIHSNIVDCRNFGGRGIGVYDLSWDDSSVSGSNGQDTGGEPEPTYVYNNITYRCGDYPSNPSGYGPSMYTNAAHSVWSNNLILESNDDLAFHADGGRLVSTVFRNNIVTLQNSADRPIVWRTNTRDTFTASHNLYFNGDLTSASTSYGSLTLGTDYVNADPKVTFSISPFELSIASDSPALGAGTNTFVTEDFFKNSLLDPRTIGPVERAQ